MKLTWRLFLILTTIALFLLSAMWIVALHLIHQRNYGQHAVAKFDQVKISLVNESLPVVQNPVFVVLGEIGNKTFPLEDLPTFVRIKEYEDDANEAIEMSLIGNVSSNSGKLVK